MPEADDLEAALTGILWELRPYLPDLVVIGGWVPYLYRAYGGFRRWNGRVTLTREVDVLVERPLPTSGRPTLQELSEARSSSRLRSEARHPCGCATWPRGKR